MGVEGLVEERRLNNTQLSYRNICRVKVVEQEQDVGMKS